MLSVHYYYAKMSDSNKHYSEEDIPVSPTSLEIILSNLFLKENGEPMEFYMRPSRFFRRTNKSELQEKMRKLKSTIEKFGGMLYKEPMGQHSIELLFPEVVIPGMDIDSDVFNAEYVEKCVESGDILDLESFRIGQSPYDGSVCINDIMKGIKSWDMVKRKGYSSRSSQGRKLPDFAPNIKPASSFRRSTSPRKSSLSPVRKKKRVEYSIKEDTAILKYLLENNLCDKLGGYSTWMKVAKEFPHHTYQSLQNRYRRTILPNIDKYKELTDSERSLFAHNSLSSSSRTYNSSDDSSSEEVINERLQGEEQTPKDNNEKENRSSLKVVEESQSSDDKDSEMDSISDNDENEAFISKKGGQPMQRRSLGRPYTIAEDRLIINYITENNRYEEIRGKNLWVDIQEGPLKPYGRSWESAKTRFRKNIMKDIESRQYQLNPTIIEQFRRGLTVDRQMGGAKKIKKKNKSPKHPALCSSTPKGSPSSSSSSMQNKRRMLYNAPRIALPVVFSPHVPPHASKKRTVPVGVNMRKDMERIGEEVEKPTVSDFPMFPMITKKLRVQLRRLTDEEIRKYCCYSTSDYSTEPEENQVPDKNPSESTRNVIGTEKDLPESKSNTTDSAKDVTESDKQTVELETNLAESETIMSQVGNDLVESETNTIDLEKNIVQLERNLSEPREDSAESDTDTVELGKNVSKSERDTPEPGTDLADSDADTIDLELEKKLMELERDIPEPEKDLVQYEVKSVETEEMASESEDNFLTTGISPEESNPLVELDPIATIDLCVESSEPSSATTADDEVDGQDREISQDSSESVIEASYPLSCNHSGILSQSPTNLTKQPNVDLGPEAKTRPIMDTESVMVISTSSSLALSNNTIPTASKEENVPVPSAVLTDQKSSVNQQKSEEIPLDIIDSEIQLVEEIIVARDSDEKVSISPSLEEVMLVDNSSDSEDYFTPLGTEKEDVEDITGEISGLQPTRSNEKETILNAVNNIFVAIEELTERRKIERCIEEPDC